MSEVHPAHALHMINSYVIICSCWFDWLYKESKYLLNLENTHGPPTTQSQLPVQLPHISYPIKDRRGSHVGRAFVPRLFVVFPAVPSTRNVVLSDAPARRLPHYKGACPAEEQ